MLLGSCLPSCLGEACGCWEGMGRAVIALLLLQGSPGVVDVMEKRAWKKPGLPARWPWRMLQCPRLICKISQRRTWRRGRIWITGQCLVKVRVLLCLFLLLSHSFLVSLLSLPQILSLPPPNHSPLPTIFNPPHVYCGPWFQGCPFLAT